MLLLASLAFATPPDDTAGALLGAALASDEAYEELVELCDSIGHRLSGSPQLDKAIAWAADEMREDGLDVRLEEVMVPRWIRGQESLTVVGGQDRDLKVLTLGNSVGTKRKGVTAEVVAVSSFEELESLGDAVKGKIVLYDVPFTTYGETVGYRWDGANRAARQGAVAALVRSVTSESLYTPHTGSMGYEDDVQKIPAAAVTIEDATWMHRLYDSGNPVTVNLTLGAHFKDDVPSANVIGEVKGRESPEEVVVVGCHLDSWDVGQGAQDDGAGCTVAMAAGALIAGLDQAPRRTVRVVLYTNEENGLRGGKAYAEAHGDEPHLAALEMDTGGGPAQGFRVDVRLPDDEAAREGRVNETITNLEPVRNLLERVGAGTLVASYAGADISPMVKGGVLGLGLQQDTSGYWPIHHTEADTVEKIDPNVHARNVAVMSLMAWWLAEVEQPPMPPVR